MRYWFGAYKDASTKKLRCVRVNRQGRLSPTDQERHQRKTVAKWYEITAATQAAATQQFLAGKGTLVTGETAKKKTTTKKKKKTTAKKKKKTTAKKKKKTTTKKKKKTTTKKSKVLVLSGKAPRRLEAQPSKDAAQKASSSNRSVGVHHTPNDQWNWKCGECGVTGEAESGRQAARSAYAAHRKTHVVKQAAVVSV